MKKLDLIACILVIIGALNWGLVGAFDFNLVTMLCGEASMLGRVVYILIGVAGLQQALCLKSRCCGTC